MSSLTEAMSTWRGRWNNPNPKIFRHPGDRWEIPDEEQRLEGHWWVPEEQYLMRILSVLVKDKADTSVYRDFFIRYVEKRMGGIPVFVTEKYGWCMIVGAVSTMLIGWMNFVLWRARAINDVPEDVLHYPECMSYTCAYRPYMTTMEIYSNFLFALGVGGLQYPRFCGFCGVVWIVGRYWYARGWYKCNPWFRKNGSFYIFGHFGVITSLLVLTVTHMIPWFVHKTKVA